jgi:hypothetical protein
MRASYFKELEGASQVKEWLCHEDFCLEDDSACANCPFPERLKEWG